MSNVSYLGAPEPELGAADHEQDIRTSIHTLLGYLTLPVRGRVLADELVALSRDEMETLGGAGSVPAG